MVTYITACSLATAVIVTILYSAWTLVTSNLSRRQKGPYRVTPGDFNDDTSSSWISWWNYHNLLVWPSIMCFNNRLGTWVCLLILTVVQNLAGKFWRCGKYGGEVPRGRRGGVWLRQCAILRGVTSCNPTTSSGVLKTVRAEWKSILWRRAEKYVPPLSVWLHGCLSTTLFNLMIL